jgi:hypothetical protein
MANPTVKQRLLSIFPSMAEHDKFTTDMTESLNGLFSLVDDVKSSLTIRQRQNDENQTLCFAVGSDSPEEIDKRRYSYFLRVMIALIATLDSFDISKGSVYSGGGRLTRLSRQYEVDFSNLPGNVFLTIRQVEPEYVESMS